LSGLTSYSLYTVTLNAMMGGTPALTDTLTVMPTDLLLFMPVSASD
jgi:hypothetical protein